MKILDEMSFEDFWCSPFVSDWIEDPYPDDKRYTVSSVESKIVEENSSTSDELEMFYDVPTIFKFYKKGPQKWIKKMELSGEQCMYDLSVTLYGDDKGEPTHINFATSHESFDFVLEPAMVDWIKDYAKDCAEIDGKEGYDWHAPFFE